eukprot:c10658_g1_i2.p1 GENE.c10658_g1_i2~~c10658_g1_i2.p1  ORF type:complete len:755 (+),score=158.88 c10658_g1_i2:51-2315(+)
MADLLDFLTKEVGLSEKNAKEAEKALNDGQVFNLREMKLKAKNKEKLKGILDKADLDQEYKDEILEIISSWTPSNNNNNNPGLDKETARKELNEVLKTATEYRKAVQTANEEAIKQLGSKLSDGLARVAPELNWNETSLSNGSKGDADEILGSLMTELDLLGNCEFGSYNSDEELVAEVSSGALRKASSFFPDEMFAEKAPRDLVDFKGVKLLTLSVDHLLDERFSSASSYSHFEKRRKASGNVHTINAEAAGFFGFGAVAATTQVSWSSAKETNSKVNQRRESSEAVHARTSYVLKKSCKLELANLLLCNDALSESSSIKDEHSALDFLRKFGTHIISAPQILGGSFTHVVTVRFSKDEEVSQQDEALEKAVVASWSVSAWGVGSAGAGQASAGGSHNITESCSKGSGKTTKNVEYSYSTSFNVNGPSVSNPALFRSMLDKNTKSLCFLDNGLDFESGRMNAVHSLVGVWDLFAQEQKHDQAKLLRDAWLNEIINRYPGVLDNENGFFSLLIKSVLTRSLKNDDENWAKPFSDRVVTGIVATNLVQHESPFGNAKHEKRKLSELDQVPVATGSGLLHSFQLRLEKDNSGNTVKFFYEFFEIPSESMTFRGSKVMVTRGPKIQATELNDTGPESCTYLDRHEVRVKPNTFLLEFQLTERYSKIHYEIVEGTLTYNNMVLGYDEADVETVTTMPDEGSSSQIHDYYFLNRHRIEPPAVKLYSALLGFRLQRSNDKNIYYKSWHIALDKIKVVGKV